MADRMLEALGLEACELSVLLTDDAGIRKLNLRHRNKDRATDVLAFPLDGEPSRTALTSPELPRLLGDVVISLDTAARQARGRRRELAAEVRLLLAHGILHLIGYDHRTASQKQRMRRMTRRLIGAAGDPRAGARATPSAKPEIVRATLRRAESRRRRSKIR